MNKRDHKEYILLTDGNKLYRLHPNHKIPKGLTEVDTYDGIPVYRASGKLKSKFNNVQRIKPQIVLSKLFIAVHNAIYSGAYFRNAN